MSVVQKVWLVESPRIGLTCITASPRVDERMAMAMEKEGEGDLSLRSSVPSIDVSRFLAERVPIASFVHFTTLFSQPLNAARAAQRARYHATGHSLAGPSSAARDCALPTKLSPIPTPLATRFD